MKEQQQIRVVDYQPAWATQFILLKSVFQQHLGDLIQAIEHVGSTSVPGLAAKPILDIDMIVEDQERMELVLDRMQTLGYRHVGDQGIPGREVLKATAERPPLAGFGTDWPRHHLYVCLEAALSLQHHLHLRDHLRANPQKIQEYSILKQQLARQFPYDMERYIDGKTTFILDILRICQ